MPPRCSSPSAAPPTSHARAWSRAPSPPRSAASRACAPSRGAPVLLVLAPALVLALLVVVQALLVVARR